jgi:hypothetical protein
LKAEKMLPSSVKDALEVPTVALEYAEHLVSGLEGVDLRGGRQEFGREQAIVPEVGPHVEEHGMAVEILDDELGKSNLGEMVAAELLPDPVTRLEPEAVPPEQPARHLCSGTIGGRDGPSRHVHYTVARFRQHAPVGQEVHKAQSPEIVALIGVIGLGRRGGPIGRGRGRVAWADQRLFQAIQGIQVLLQPGERGSVLMQALSQSVDAARYLLESGRLFGDESRHETDAISQSAVEASSRAHGRVTARTPVERV